MYIEIKGVQFVNKGAELMLLAVIQRVKQYWPDANIVLEDTPLSPYKSRALLGAYQKLSLRKNIIDLNSLSYFLPRKVHNYLKKWGIVTESQISIVFDASGFAYGDQWSALNISRLGGELKRYKKHNSKYIFLPQAFGPFSRSNDKQTLRLSLPDATLICAREQRSYNNLRDIIGDAKNLVQFSDFTNAVEGIIPDYWINGQQRVCFIPNSNMISAKNKNESWKRNYINIMTLLMQHAQSLGFEVILLNHEGEGDRDICHNLNQYFNDELEIIEESDPLKIKGIIGDSKAVVCSRFHGCVSALSQGVVTLGTSWSHKYDQLYSEYGVPDLLINPDDNEEVLVKLMSSLFDENENFTSIIADNAIKYKAITEMMWAKVIEEIEDANAIMAN